MAPVKLINPVFGAPVFTAAMVMVGAVPVRLLAAVIVVTPTPARVLVKVMVKKLGPAAVTLVAWTSGRVRAVLPPADAEVESSPFRAAWMLAARVIGLGLQ